MKKGAHVELNLKLSRYITELSISSVTSRWNVINVIHFTKLFETNPKCTYLQTEYAYASCTFSIIIYVGIQWNILAV